MVELMSLGRRPMGLLLISQVAVAQVQLTSEVDVGSRRGGPSAAAENRPMGAYGTVADAGVWVVAFQDARADLDALPGLEDYDVFLAVLDGGLNRLGQNIRLTRETVPELTPAIAYDGEAFMVAWTTATGKLMAARFDVSTRAVGAAAEVSATAEPGLRPALLKGPSGVQPTTLVAWAGPANSAGYPIWATHLGPSGAPLRPATLLVPQAADALGAVGPQLIAAGPSGPLLLWETHVSGRCFVNGAFVDGTPALVSAPVQPINTLHPGHCEPSASWDGANWLVSIRTAGDFPLVQRVNPGFDAVNLTVSFDAGVMGASALVFDGTHHLLVHNDLGGEVLASRLSPAGALVDLAPLRLTRGSFVNVERFTAPSASVGPSGATAFWAEQFDTHVVAREVAVGAPTARPVTESPLTSIQFALDAHRGRVLVAHANSVDFLHPDFVTDLRFSLFDSTPAAWGTPDQLIADYENNGQTHPSVAPRDGGFLVSFARNQSGAPRLATIRIDLDVGRLDDVTNRTWETLGDFVSPQLARGPTGYWAAGYAGSWQIVAARLDDEGIPVSSAFSVGPGTATRTLDELRISFDGQRLLLVWPDDRDTSRRLYGAWLEPDGGRPTPGGFPIGSDAGGDRTPALAAYQGRTVVAWETRANGSSDVHVALLESGSQTPTPLTSVPSARSPALAPASQGAWLAYSREDAGHGDVYGLVLPLDGGACGTSFPISATPDDEEFPKLAAEDGQVWVLYQRFDPQVLAPRLKLRRLSLSSCESTVPVDAGVADAGPSDGGTPGPSVVRPTVLSVDCGCSGAGGALAPPLLWALWKLQTRRRREPA